MRPDAVSRPHLLQILMEGLDQPGAFALISGPAGFGKTSLLSEFAGQRVGQIAWVSLDENDNDPYRFWTHLIAACQNTLPALADVAATISHSPQPLPGTAIAAALINAIASMDGSLFVILDDYHAIHNEEIHTAFVFLLEHLPVQMHPVVSTRIDPPWPLARFRARNQLVEIRARDLRFNETEAGEFLNGMLNARLTPRDIAILEERTEGWAAGLQLAALSMKGRQDIAGFIAAFKGSHVYIAEYLVEEVLNRQPAEVQTFLLNTSILKQLNPQLCQAVTGFDNGDLLLAELYRENLFVVALDDQGEWFRYHHLFADLLKARLNRHLPKAEIDLLHQRAAEWYEQHGLIADAFEHALAAEDYARAIGLLETIALPMILQAFVKTVEDWLRAVPEAWIVQSPRLNMAFAWLNLFRGTSPQAVPYITRLQEIFTREWTSDPPPSIQGEWLALQAEWLIAQGKPEESRELANRALRVLPAVDMNVRNLIYVTLAKAFQLTYDYENAAEVFRMIARDAQQAGDPIFETLGISGEGQMALKQGLLRRTFELATGAIQKIELSGIKIPFSATLFGELGEVYFHWHEFEQARIYQARSMETSGKNGYSDPEIYHHLMVSRMLLMDGDLQGAEQEMQVADRLASETPPAMIRANLIAQQVSVELAMGRIPPAEGILEAEGFSFGDAIHFPNLTPKSKFSFDAGLLYNSGLRLVLFKAKKGPDARMLRAGLDLSGSILDGELACRHLPLVLKTLLLRAQLFAALGETRQSLAEVSRALELAEPEGFISSFVEEGNPVADLLKMLSQRGQPGQVRPGYIQEILACFPRPLSAGMGTRPKARAAAEDSALVEPLTPRELEVLRLIAAGDTNQTIGGKLFITVSAVKKHTTNIFGKLNVNSRTQAVAQARQLGLLPLDA